MEIEVEHQPEQSRFRVEVDGTESVLRYSRAEDTLDLRSTWVDPDVRGRGIGERLVLTALEHARSEGLSIIPTCWFVETVLDRHPEHRDLLAGG